MTHQLAPHARRGRRRLTAIGLVLLSTLACEDAPTAPTSSVTPAPPVAASAVAATVTGTVWEHGPGGAVRALAGARFSGYHWTVRGGMTLGWMAADPQGRFALSLPDGQVIALYADGPYQPCAVRFEVGTTPVARDLHVFTSDAELGAALPADMLAQGVLLTGTVYERVDGRQVPIAGASVYVDGAGGMGVPLARTRTDGHGRYVICGSSLGGQPALDVSAAGFRSIEIDGRVLHPGATVDVELRR